MTFSFFFFSVELFQKAHLFLIPFNSSIMYAYHLPFQTFFVFEFSEHLSLDSLLHRLPSPRYAAFPSCR